MKINFLEAFVLFILITSCSNQMHPSGDQGISIELHHTNADRVYFVYMHQGELYETMMTKISETEFRAGIDLPDGEYLCNIKSESELYPGIFDWAGKPSGIDAIKVSINNVPISPDYLVRQDGDPQAAFSLTIIDQTVFRGEGDYWNPDVRIPPELPQYHHYCRYKTPPEGFNAALPWMHAFHTGGESSTSTVEIDYLRLYAQTTEGSEILLSDEYDTHMPLSGYDHGSTYNRYPFFFNEETDNWAMPAQIMNGSLIITPHSHRERAFHWWSSSRVEIPHNTDYLVIESRVRITGDAIVQIGLDYWKDLSAPYEGLDINNTEAGVSDIIFPAEPSIWQEISYSTEEIIPWVF